ENFEVLHQYERDPELNNNYTLGKNPELSHYRQNNEDNILDILKFRGPKLLLYHQQNNRDSTSVSIFWWNNRDTSAWNPYTINMKIASTCQQNNKNDISDESMEPLYYQHENSTNMSDRGPEFSYHQQNSRNSTSDKSLTPSCYQQPNNDDNIFDASFELLYHPPDYNNIISGKDSGPLQQQLVNVNGGSILNKF
ncbi:6909_t:CDS:10, partial [Racocetra persica]